MKKLENREGTNEIRWNILTSEPHISSGLYVVIIDALMILKSGFSAISVFVTVAAVLGTV
mgnify:CR=1 FL=1